MSDTAPGAGGAASGNNPALIPGAELPPGFVVGEYRIDGIAGRGGMGVVYAAMHPVIEKRVAIKVLAMHFSETPELVRRFVDEARAVNRIGHENIIDIFSFGQLGDGRQYFVMEYLEGATLAERLDRGDLQPADVPPVLGQICDALDAAHAKQIIHRDLKPENVWIATSNRGVPKVRLLDFGIAKLLDTGDRVVTDIGAVMGTPHFMSPEQCHGRGVDHRTDIYAMGVILYRLFAGRLPFRGETFAEILSKQLTETPPNPSTFAIVPGELDRLIMRCLEKDPTRRPQSAGELGASLATIFSVAAPVASLPRSADSERLMSPSMVSSATELAPQKIPTARAAAAAPDSARGRFALLVLGVALLVLAGIGVAWFTRNSATPAVTSDQTKGPAEKPTAAVPVAPPGVPSIAPPAVPLPAASTGHGPAPSPTGLARSPADPSPEPRAFQAPRGSEKTAANKRRPGPESVPGDPAQAPKPSRATSNGLVTRNPFE